MSMYCFQCQEAANNSACTVRGVCGKSSQTALLQDLLIDRLKKLATISDHSQEQRLKIGRTVCQGLFATITNANFDDLRILGLIFDAEAQIAAHANGNQTSALLPRDLSPQQILTSPAVMEILLAQAQQLGVLATQNEDVRSLRELTIYGLKGVAAYAEHAAVLGFEEEPVYAAILKALALSASEEDPAALTALVLETGNTAVKAMALLDKANTQTYGNPEITKVNIGVGTRPGILISGHDLHDMKQLLEQTKDTGVDVYTHSEMLAANYYPEFKKYAHFVGNYGNAWWQQDKEFASFNGPILMTTNCIVPVRPAYADRIWTTGMAGYPNVPHLTEQADGSKDFSQLIARAKVCLPPQSLEEGSIVGGFAHVQIKALAGKVVDAIKSGAISKFVIMAGCDGRHKSRDYFGDLADALPKSTVILTAGCAKFRYNKKQLGDIAGIPRVLDAGQCNDSYSLAVTALTLKEAFGLADVNDLPIDFAIAWYEQKAVAVLLALLSLGFKNIRLGPTLPAFLSPGVAKVLVENFGIRATSTVEQDVAAITA